MWVGGHSRAVLQRRARHGNSWHPIGGAVAFPLRLQEVWAHLDMLKQPTEAGRRDFSALTISYKAPLYDIGIPCRTGPAGSSPASRNTSPEASGLPSDGRA